MMNSALDPQKSVVVEACAGSGKTWLLVSRLVRLLLAGVPPSAILAITYTRKAAAEIESRLAEALRDLALQPDEAVVDFLTQRGLHPTEARRLLPQARGLFEQVVLADQPPTITTFHGWFVRLVSVAPLSAGLSGRALASAAAPLLEEAWARVSRRCAKAPQSEVTQALLALLDDPGLVTARTLLAKFIDRRAEWRALGLPREEVLAGLRAQLGVSEALDADQQFLARPGLVAALHEFAALLIATQNKSETARGQALAEALASGEDARVCEGWLAAVLTQKHEIRVCKLSEALKKRMGEGPAQRYFELHESLGCQALELHHTRQEEAAYRLNRAVLTVGEALAEALDEVKAARRVMDFADLENHADALLGGEDAPFLQARLDARYQQILLDEFQDTNPLQWRILRAWFDAYGPGEAPPKVFLVGDPKQSIYRFRRAEPRVFEAAGNFLCEQFQAEKIFKTETRRNAQTVVAVVNQLFGSESAFTGFLPQSAFHGPELPGRVELIPLCGKTASEQADTDEAMLRDPLQCKHSAGEEDTRRESEARAVAERIAAWVGRLAIVEDGRARPARYDDFMLLCRTRTHLATFEAALRAARIPYFSGARGGLLESLEAQDLAALLGFLACPADDLKLAHTLRSPLFALSDVDLMLLAQAGEGPWWPRLAALAPSGAAIERAYRLLQGWINCAAHWPVHDVLATVFGEADVLARYRAVTPALMWPSVQANLEAFLALSLQIDGGRYPSLSRFNDELKRLRAAREEAPDEGVIDAGEAAGRVRILTVHAAKGLEAPLVWLLDAHRAGDKTFGHEVLLDWPPQAHAPRHFSVVGGKGTRGRARDALLQAEQQAALREELNLLYVAITRARQYFVASGIEPLTARQDPTHYTRLHTALEALGGEGALAYGAEFEWVEASPVASPPPLPTLPRLPKLNIGTRREQDSAEQRYGTALHLALECLSQNRPLPEGLDEAAAAQARQILAAGHLQRFFDPARFVRAANEAEFVLPDGTTGRVDRWVDDGEVLWVLDYKAGRPEEALLAAYRLQLARYGRAVALLHPGRSVRCGLIYGDGQWQEL